MGFHVHLETISPGFSPPKLHRRIGEWMRAESNSRFFAALSYYDSPYPGPNFQTLSGWKSFGLFHPYPKALSFSTLPETQSDKLLSHLLRFLLAIPILLQLLLPALHPLPPQWCTSRQAPHVIAGRELIVAPATHEVLAGRCWMVPTPRTPCRTLQNRHGSSANEELPVWFWRDWTVLELQSKAKPTQKSLGSPSAGSWISCTSVP